MDEHVDLCDLYLSLSRVIVFFFFFFQVGAAINLSHSLHTREAKTHEHLLESTEKLIAARKKIYPKVHKQESFTFPILTLSLSLCSLSAQVYRKGETEARIASTDDCARHIARNRLCIEPPAAACAPQGRSLEAARRKLLLEFAKSASWRLGRTCKAGIRRRDCCGFCFVLLFFFSCF